MGSDVLQAVVLDWAGTVVDHGSSAPAIAFREAFQELGVPLGEAEARGPMGLAKRDHVQHVLAQPNVAAKWRERFGEDPDAFAVDTVMAVFEPLSTSTAAIRADLIPGALAAVADCRRRGLRIGSTTGYTRPVMEQLISLAARQGYAPDLVVCAGDVPEGRPSPLMMWHTMATLGVWPAETVVKVDDTAPGILEGRNAGTWTIGIAPHREHRRADGRAAGEPGAGRGRGDPGTGRGRARRRPRGDRLDRAAPGRAGRDRAPPAGWRVA